MNLQRSPQSLKVTGVSLKSSLSSAPECLECHGLLISVEIIVENYSKQPSFFGASKYL